MTTQRVPWAAWSPFPGRAGGSTSGNARKITLHTTEGSGWPSYGGGGSAPHLTVNPATGEARQHIDLDKSAYALSSPGAPTSPNMNAGLIHVQIEIIGYAAQAPTYSRDWYTRLAQWVGWLCDELGVPKAAPWPFAASSTAVRQTWDTYAAGSGIVGHGHAPYNDHWDPGALDIGLLLALMDHDTEEDEMRVIWTTPSGVGGILTGTAFCGIGGAEAAALRGAGWSEVALSEATISTWKASGITGL